MRVSSAGADKSSAENDDEQTDEEEHTDDNEDADFSDELIPEEQTATVRTHISPQRIPHRLGSVGAAVHKVSQQRISARGNALMRDCDPGPLHALVRDQHQSCDN